MPLILQMYKLEKKMASDHRKCPIKHLIQWTQVKKLPIIHLFQHLNSYQEPNHTIWSCQTLRKASRQCVESHQQKSSGNIFTPLVLVFPSAFFKPIVGQRTRNQSWNDRKETKGMKQTWQILEDGEMRGKVSLHQFRGLQ